MGPALSTAGTQLKVAFYSNKERQARGAVCRVSCSAAAGAGGAGGSEETGLKGGLTIIIQDRELIWIAEPEHFTEQSSAIQ